MRLKHCCIFLLSMAIIGIFGHNLHSQALYSYLDQNGTRVFTNIPPVNAVWDLKVTGSPAPAPAVDESRPKSEKFDPIIEKYAGEHNLDPSLIRSIIATESGFNPKAVSRKGAQGLMQLMPATAARLGVTNSFDPEQNIRGGVRHFRSLMDTFDNDLHLSLAAYNAGENLVMRLGRVPAIKETRNYVQSITQRLNLDGESTQAEEKPKHAPTFRYFDGAGVLHLTNIPPLR